MNNNTPSTVVEIIRRFTESKIDKKEEVEEDGPDEEKGDYEDIYEKCDIEFLPLTAFCQQIAIQNFASSLEIECCPSNFNGKRPSQTDIELYLASQPNFDSPEIVN